MISADYSQIELRIMAHLSKDKNLTNAFKKGLDVHSSTAAEVFGVKIENVTDVAKNLTPHWLKLDKLNFL